MVDADGRPMLKIGFHRGPQHGEYRVMRDRWRAAEELGVDRLYSSDHFFYVADMAEQLNGLITDADHLRAAECAMGERE
jgi:alkanesulfonate monooxygenase SsuD/methylene tetrahydromethanopterin reductase-like flavin-dependent oxidoreductase (luciferase family)